MREDLRSAARSVFRTRTLTAVLLITLGLGTGANAAVFSVVRSVLFGVPDGLLEPGGLVSIFTTQFDGTPYGPSSMPDYDSIVASVRTLDSVAAVDDRTTTNARLGDVVQMTRAGVVSGNFFRVLGMAPSQGRTLDERDFNPSSRTAVISHALWEAAGRRDIASLTLNILGGERKVVGITPPRFRGLESGRVVDVWIPMSAGTADRHRGHRSLTLIGRLRDGRALDEANRELTALSERLANDSPSTNRGIRNEPEKPRLITARSYSPLQPEASAQAAILAGIIAATVLMLLVSACLNAGTLLLSRGFARRRELAVKMALGATRPQLARQLLLESLLTTVAGAAVGLLFAAWTLRIVPSLFSPEQAAKLDTTLPVGVILATIVIALVAGAVFGIAPAFHGTSSPASLALRADSGGVSDGPGGRGLRAVLVAAQIALSTLLLIGSGLLFGSLQNALDADRSFPAENVAVATIVNPGKFGDPLRGIAFQKTLTDRLRKDPGVQAIGWATTTPLMAPTRDEFRIEAGAAGVTDTVQLDINVVSPTYFEAMGLQLLEGRQFTAEDRALTKPVVVVDELLARRYFGETAARQHLLDLTGERFEIVGVVRGRRFRTLQETPRPTVYFPVAQRYVPNGNLFVVMRGDATSLVMELPRLIHRIDSDAAVVRVARLDKHLSESLVIDRLATTLVGVCGILALVMAVAGVYGVMNDTVQRRTREIGLRIALGAARRQVARLVLGEALYVSLGGLAAGTILALAGGRIGGMLVSGVPQWTARTLGAPSVLLMLIVLGAAILPLRRALAVSAASALRTE